MKTIIDDSGIWQQERKKKEKKKKEKSENVTSGEEDKLM